MGACGTNGGVLVSGFPPLRIPFFTPFGVQGGAGNEDSLCIELEVEGGEGRRLDRDLTSATLRDVSGVREGGAFERKLLSSTS
mmetsp:Transcript_16537/g.24466  ORF Transcript_16537/g.24466 Transcript_16537/m.24466 type:complete len:83 (+) Transcript_16537:1954-2202(+)